jgi:hypothetical protein
MATVTVNETFSDVGASEPIPVAVGQPYTLEITGTFVGTLIMEASEGNGNWTPLASYTDVLDQTGFTVPTGPEVFCLVRIRCSEYTSGDPEITLSVTAPAIQAWINKAGKTVFQVTEDGVENGPGTTTVVHALESDGEVYDETGHSFQVVAADLELDPAAGSSDGSNPKFLAPGMGNLIGDTLTADANYLAGWIGAYSVIGTKATTFPAGALLGIIMDGVTAADGAVVAVIDGDSAVTKATAAFKAMMNNSNAGSGFEYGLDLYGPAHDGFLALAILKALSRSPHEVCDLEGAGVPTDGSSGTGAGFAGPGSRYTDYTNANLYINGNTKASPTWKLVTRAA